MSKFWANKKFAYFALATLVIIALLVWLTVFQAVERKDRLKLVFCDVGQGDAILIQIPENQDILIDGGPDNSVLSCLGENMPFYDRKIESIILTHPDADHSRGLVEVVKRYEIGEIWLTGVHHDLADYTEFLSLIKERDILTKTAKVGEIVFQDEKIKLKILYPKENLEGREVSNLNNTSVVARLVYQNFSAIFTGDLEEDKQRDLIDQPSIEISADIFKVSHHGSANGLLTEFLSQVNPEIAVISVGENNRYGHPSPKILDKLKMILGIEIFRTDQNGDIKIFSDGKDYQIRTQKQLK